MTTHDDIDRDEASLDWARIANALLAYWWVLLAAPLLAGLVAFAAAKTLPREYEASALLMVSARINPTSAELVDVGRFMAPLEVMMRNRGLARSTIASLGLEKSGLAPDELLSRITVEPDEDAGAIRVLVRYPDPARVAEIANTFARHAVAFAQTATLREAASAAEALRLELERAESRYRLAESQLLSYRRQAQVTLGERDLEAMLAERGRLIALQARIAAERSAVQRAESELAAASPVREVPRVADGPVGASAPVRMRGGESGAYMNPVYESLQWQVATGRATLAGLESEYATLT
nr:hypothetical protein [Acidobacteriota bacterium]